MTPTFWRRTGELSLRGTALAVIVHLGFSPDAGGIVSPDVFDRLVSVDTGKVAVVGAVLSVLFSVASAVKGDPNQPTVR